MRKGSLSPYRRTTTSRGAHPSDRFHSQGYPDGTDSQSGADISPTKRAAEYRLKESYGKWYVSPADYNSSMMSKVKKIQREAQIKAEVAEEKRVQENAKFFLRNYRLLEK